MIHRRREMKLASAVLRSIGEIAYNYTRAPRRSIPSSKIYTRYAFLSRHRYWVTRFMGCFIIADI